MPAGLCGGGQVDPVDGQSKGAGKSGGDGSGVEESKGEEKDDTKSDKAAAPSAGTGEDGDAVL
jgi:hypothetical protein